MTRYITQRLMVGLLTAFIVSLILFAILRTNIDPLDFIICTDDCVITKEESRKIKEDFGVHGPLHTQYLSWMGGWATGDWGESWFSSENIREMFFKGLPTTLQLVAMAQVVATLVGVPAGVLMALKRNSWIDRLGRTTSGMWLGLPIFWTSTLLLVGGIYFFEWEPSVGYIPLLDDPRGNLLQFFWPALFLSLPAATAVALMTRSSTLNALRQDHVQAMAVSGPDHSAAVFLHTLRYALVPTAVILGLTFPAIIGGALLMERVFWLDGVGHLLAEALNQRDYPVIESLALFFAVWVIAINTAVDVLCGWLDASARSTRKSPREEWDHLANPVRLA